MNTQEALKKYGYHLAGCGVFANFTVSPEDGQEWEGSRDKYLADDRCTCGLRDLIFAPTQGITGSSNNLIVASFTQQDSQSAKVKP